MQEAVDLPDLFAGLARSVVGAVYADACKVSLVESDGETLREVAAFARDRSLLGITAELISLEEHRGVRSVIETKIPLGISMSDEEPLLTEHAALADTAYNYRLICPLSAEGRVIGTIDVFRIDDRPFRADDPKQISLLATFAANAYARIQMAQRLDAHYMETLSALAAALEARDPDTRDHTNRMHDLADALAQALELSPRDRRAVKLGAVLHDIGKIGIPDSILRKPGPLTQEEWDVMRMHPVIGERMISDIGSLKVVLPAVRHHHERWDGRGYPDGLRDEAIPVPARIIAVCDAFDAMTSNRPYRSAVTIERALHELKACAGSQFDPTHVDVFSSLVEELGIDDLGERILRFA